MSRASETIALIQHEFSLLQRDYILYFSGSTPKEPVDKRAYLEKQIRLLGSMTKIKPSEIFQADNLISKVHSHLRLWDKQLERKQNRLKDKFQEKRGTESPKPAETDHHATKIAPPTKPGLVQITNANTERESIVSLYDQYIRLNIKTGSKKQIGFGNFQNFIQSQTSKFQKRGARTVEFEITQKAGKVVIKTRKAK
ncbi:MAG: hypothetical protein CSA81_05865 [Acidobacteria bacterium]|nr:MAG: hypothetical protein CSA81_05865 [Acidobacteriota bacterium]